jgi:hypothetical protein
MLLLCPAGVNSVPVLHVQLEDVRNPSVTKTRTAMSVAPFILAHSYWLALPSLCFFSFLPVRLFFCIYFFLFLCLVMAAILQDYE